MNPSNCRRRVHALRALLLAAAVALAGCMQAPDLTAVQAEREKTVRRTDGFQSAAGNGKVLVAGTRTGVLVTSADGGRNWSRQELARPASVIALTDCPDGSFVGLDFYKKLWLGDAEGKQWQSRPLDEDINALAVDCDSAGRIWVVGSHTAILSSSDRGATWSKTDLGEDAFLTAVHFVDDKHGFIVGEFGIVLSTADGGASWTRQPPVPGDFYPYSAVFTDVQHGWMSGVGGGIVHTADGGKSWTPQSNRAEAPMYMLVRQGREIYGLGAGGQMVVLRGTTWERHEHGQQLPATLVAGAVLDANALLVAGGAGTLQVVNAPARVAVAAKP